LTALHVASEPVFMAVRLAGAAYLVYLGASTLWHAWRRGHAPARQEPAGDGAATGAPGRAFRQGLLSNLGNPKMVVFFSSLLPQFAPVGVPAFLGMLGLGLVFCTMTVTWLAGYAWVVARAGVLLQRPRVRRAFDTVTGIILVALGLRLATEPVPVDR
jgi:threonine/homoserine/homoserine lactone efflux protein